MKRFRIKTTSGEYSDRYVGLPLGSGLVTDPATQKNPPVNVPGTNYDLYLQQGEATQFFEQGAKETLARLRALGYELEMIEVIKREKENKP